MISKDAINAGIKAAVDYLEAVGKSNLDQFTEAEFVSFVAKIASAAIHEDGVPF